MPNQLYNCLLMIVSPSASELQMLYSLHGKYFGLLMNIGLKYGWTREDIKDIINQMFLDFIDQKVQINAIINPKAYLTVTFRRKLVDIARKNNKAKQLHDFLISEEEYETGIDEIIEQEQYRAEMSKKIKIIFEKLPPRCKKVISLKFYDGLTTEQIAEKTGISRRSVYNNLFEGLKLLKAALAEGKFAGAPSLFSIFLLLSWLLK